jgi:hypothetical protein
VVTAEPDGQVLELRPSETPMALEDGSDLGAVEVVRFG